MFNVTETAQQKVAEHLEGKDMMPVRIFLQQGGCGGPQLMMALDDKKKNDTVFELSGIEYLVDKTLLETIQPVEIDFIETGFKINSSLKASGCSTCGEGDSCCS